MKKEILRINATPSKRIFLSIIADYDLNRSICELIDNALDIWVKYGKKKSLDINILIDINQQVIRVCDNAGGIKKDELSKIVSPGETSNLPTDEIIGIFGVGTKRAVVALAQDINIITRYPKSDTFRVELDDDWLKSDDWELPVYEVDTIGDGTTIIELYKLRMVITNDSINHLKEHLQVTYAKFFKNKLLNIKLNSSILQPIYFENWAYPPNFSPHHYYGDLRTEDGKVIKVDVIAGLTKESSPTGGEYGVYFYCNDRLIGRALKAYEVGFTKGLAGHPHPSISLARIIISLYGEAQLMPWNSSKSGVNYNHRIFIALRNWFVQVVKDYASLSRRWEGEWPGKVFKYRTGRIITKKIEDFPLARSSYLPELPKTNLRYGDLIVQANRKITKNKPWTKGLYESMIAVDLILKQNLDQRNRIALILLDSNLEIAFKEFLVNESKNYYSDKKLLEIFSRRNQVEVEMKKYVKFPSKIWGKINYYYNIRCKLIHERATIGISDRDIEDYKDIVKNILKALFKLKL